MNASSRGFFFGCCLLCGVWVQDFFSSFFFYLAYDFDKAAFGNTMVTQLFYGFNKPLLLPCILNNVASICTQVVLNYR